MDVYTQADSSRGRPLRMAFQYERPTMSENGERHLGFPFLFIVYKYFSTVAAHLCVIFAAQHQLCIVNKESCNENLIKLFSKVPNF